MDVGARSGWNFDAGPNSWPGITMEVFQAAIVRTACRLRGGIKKHRYRSRACYRLIWLTEILRMRDP